ncbi:MAG: DUF2851 family protein [Candidatus Hydrogenedentes bacterium]|nr:DUF2851 family protein [Candidatus Hydrogenedentota bacterium]
MAKSTLLKEYTSSLRENMEVREEGEYKEIDVHYLWGNVLRKAKTWQTLEGSQVRILVPGERNVFSGPDFRNAVIEINGVQFRGDVEIHKSIKDWYIHGHHLDADYNRVILHVVFEYNGKYRVTKTSDGKIIETIVVNDLLDSIELCEVRKSTGFCKRSPCISQFYFDFSSLIKSLAQERLFSRIERMKLRARSVSLDQVLYEQLFWSLGAGTRFGDAYLHLAEKIPYSLACEISNISPQLLGMVYLSELGYFQHQKDSVDSYIDSVKDKLFNMQGLENIVPHSLSSNNRYLNSPYPAGLPPRRVIIMSSVISLHRGSLVTNLLEFLKRSLEFEKPWLQWRGFFISSSYHCPENFEKSVRIGVKKIISIVGNVVIPFAIYCYFEGIFGVREEELWKLYFSLPGEGENWILRKMERISRDFVSNKPLRFFEQQGLIQWYWHNCSHHPDCIGCIWNSAEKKLFRDIYSIEE